MLRTNLFGVRNCSLGLAIVTLALLAASPSFGQLSMPQLSSVYPPGGKQGTDVEVTIAGTNLVDVSQLLFSHDGLTAKQKSLPTDEVFPEPRPVANQFTVSIAASVPPGIYEVRTVGRYGVSNPLSFQVGVLTEVLDDNTNKSFDKARMLELGSFATGRVDAGGRDYWKIALKKDQRVLIECMGERIDSAVDGTLTLYDAAGQEVARSRDLIGYDPLIDFTAPLDGEYVVAIYDFVFSGGADYVYRLAVHNRPHIDFIFPPSGVPGSNNEYTIYGRNLPGGKPVANLTVEGAPLEQLTAKIQIPAEPETEIAGRLAPHASGLYQSVLYRVDSPEGASNGAAVAIAEAPIVVESADNDDPASSQMVTVPCEFVGQFYPRKDVDWLQFEAKKDEVFNIEVYSHRLGLDVDPYIVVQKVTKNAEGVEQVADIADSDDPPTRATKIGTDFDVTTDDPSYRLTVKEDAVYRIMVRDQFGASQADPRNVYRVAITKEAADFALVAAPAQVRPANANIALPSSLSVRRGAVAVLDVNVIRFGGYKGEVTISAEGMPAGVTCSGVASSGANETVALVFSATEDAAPWVGPIKVFGTAKVGDADVRRRACGGTMTKGTSNRTVDLPVFRLTRNVVLAVVDKESVPVQVTVGDGATIETARGAKLELPATVVRRDEFKTAFKLTAVGLPAELKPKVLDVPAEGDGKVEIELTNAKLAPGLYSFILRGDVKFKYSPNPDAIAAAEAEQKRLDELVKALTEKAKTDEAAKKTLTAATAAKKKADAAVAAVKKANAQKDLTYWSISTPILLRVADSPIQLSATAVTVKQGEKVEIPVTVERLFGFEDQVDVTVVLPGGVAGLTGKLTVPKDQTEGKLEITAAANATVGDHEITLRGATKYNNVPANTDAAVKIKVEAAEKK